MHGTIRRRWGALASSVFLCLLSVVSVACADNTSTLKNSPPPPLLLYWSPTASAGATTPQAAYALSAHFAPCLLPNDSDHTTTAPDQSVTWLLSGPDVGVAYLRATCRDTFRGDYLYRYFLVIVKGAQNAWYEEGIEGKVSFPPGDISTLTPDSGPPSLVEVFPADTYYGGPSPWRATEPVSVAGRLWVALTPRDYVLGLIRDSIIRPPDAIATTVGGLPGWVTEANGMATIVAPRADGTVFFFAGTGTVSEIEALATRALPRAEDALGDPLPPALTPTP